MAMIAALAQSGWDVVGADGRKMPLGIRSRYAPLFYLDYSGNMDRRLEALIEMIKREKPDVVLPLFETDLFCKNREALLRHTHILVPDYTSFSMASNKTDTMRECRMLGIEVPKILNDEEAIELLRMNDTRQGAAKVIVKPNWNVGGARGLTVVSEAGRFIEARENIERAFGRAIIQEYIPGVTENMRTVNLVFDQKSRLASYFTTKKIRQLPPQGGITVLSVSTNEPELVEMVMPFFKKWRWQGPAEAEIKIDERDGKPRLIEINPRFWGYVGFPIRCGVNFPLITAQLAMGASADSFAFPSYPVGIKYIDPVSYAKSIVQDCLNGRGAVGTLLTTFRELKGPKVGNNVKMADPLFLIGKLLIDVRSLISGRTGY
jgi:predicted ATP-grasp superfamily ATP-dependent carboligase